VIAEHAYYMLCMFKIMVPCFEALYNSMKLLIIGYVLSFSLRELLAVVHNRVLVVFHPLCICSQLKKNPCICEVRSIYD
jgi:hypothetical protein